MKSFQLPRLGVNIDHLATLRQLRGTPYPSLREAVRLIESAGAHQITVHLREDRRHIQDDDVKAIRKDLKLQKSRLLLNLEMAATPAMMKFALRIKPHWVCVVPERRQEVTTEGGLDVVRNQKRLAGLVKVLRSKDIQVSLFIEPSIQAVKAAQAVGAHAVEFHTGEYCRLEQAARLKKKSSRKPGLAPNVVAALKKIQTAGLTAQKLGLHVHAGHGFDDVNVRPVAQLMGANGRELVEEYNIGHFIVCRAALVGMDQAVKEMVSAIQAP